MADIKARDIKLVEIEKLVPNPKNNNRHPVEQLERLAKIIEFQGFRDPIIVSNRSGFIVCGHARLDVAKKIGMEKVPVVYQDFDSEAQEYAHLTADNEIARWAELDYQELYENLKEIELDDVDMLGIEDFKMPEVEELNPQADEDDVPEAPPEPVTKRGDIWLLGNHRLMCGDSTLIDDVEKLMNGEKADMVFTDPPYNIASDSKNFAAGTSRSMNDLKNSEWDKGFKIEDFLPLAIEQTKDSATYYVWSSHFLISKIWDILKEYCDFHSYLIWDKPNPMPSLSKRHPTWNTEICGYGTRGSKRIVNFPKDGHFLSCREVIKKSDGSHPTQKPLELIEPLIEFSSSRNQLIIDMFLGSGSTLIACEKTNRKCYGMELDEKYCDIIINRWQNYTGKEAVLESTGETYNSLKEIAEK